MADITPGMIKELRERTGVGMAICKKALEEAHGDMELAIANLRKAGMASAVKKEGRETKEGKIGVAETDRVIALVEVNAETDFVVNNERFQNFVEMIANEVAETSPSSLDAFLQQPCRHEPSLTVDQYRATIVQTIGENIQIKRIIVLPKSAERSIGVYSHANGKIVTVAEISGSDQEVSLAKDIGMHIAAASPDYLSPAQVPQEIVDNEREIAKGQMEGKPAYVIDKIVEGKINAFYDAACLTRQKYIKDDSVSITELVERRGKETGKTLALVNFLRWSIG